MNTDPEALALARNIALTRALLGFLNGVGCAEREALCALLTAATTLIERGSASDQRLKVLNEYLGPTIQEWAGAGQTVTIQ